MNYTSSRQTLRMRDPTYEALLKDATVWRSQNTYNVIEVRVCGTIVHSMLCEKVADLSTPGGCSCCILQACYAKARQSPYLGEAEGSTPDLPGEQGSTSVGSNSRLVSRH